MVKYMQLISKILLAISLITYGYGLANSDDIDNRKDDNRKDDSRKDDNRIKIAVIDSGMDMSANYLCKSGHTDFTGMGLNDVINHGRNVAALIMNNVNPSKYCLVNIKWYHNKQVISRDYAWILDFALSTGAKYVNISADGNASSKAEENLLREAVKKGVKIVVAAGNSKKNLDVKCDVYPACYDIKEGYYVVGNWSNISNYGHNVRRLEGDYGKFNVMEHDIYGTSFSAASFTNQLLRGMVK